MAEAFPVARIPSEVRAIASRLRDAGFVVRNLEGPKVVVVGSDETRSEFIETLPKVQ